MAETTVVSIQPGPIIEALATLTNLNIVASVVAAGGTLEIQGPRSGEALTFRGWLHDRDDKKSVKVESESLNGALRGLANKWTAV